MGLPAGGLACWTYDGEGVAREASVLRVAKTKLELQVASCELLRPSYKLQVAGCKGTDAAA